MSVEKIYENINEDATDEEIERANNTFTALTHALDVLQEQLGKIHGFTPGLFICVYQPEAGLWANAGNTPPSMTREALKRALVEFESGSKEANAIETAFANEKSKAN